MSFKVNDKHTLEEYNKKYQSKNLLVITKEEADRNPSVLENKSWWLINNSYYEVTEDKKGFAGWWTGLSKLVRAIIISVLCIAVIVAIVVPVVIETKPDEEGITSSTIEYMDPFDDYVTYSFDKSLTSIKSNETEWSITVTIDNNRPADWTIIICDMSKGLDNMTQDDIIAQSETYDGHPDPGTYTKTVKLLDGINLADYANKTLTVMFLFHAA